MRSLANAAKLLSPVIARFGQLNHPKWRPLYLHLFQNAEVLRGDTLCLSFLTKPGLKKCHETLTRLGDYPLHIVIAVAVGPGGGSLRVGRLE